MSFKPLRIATRRSPLAMAQARWVQGALAANAEIDDCPVDDAFPIIAFETTGDRRLEGSLADAGGKGLFTKEVEDALIDGRADVAVHSMKDMPAELPKGLVIAGVPAREDPRDALVSLSGYRIEDLPHGAVCGTSSVRRAAQLLRLRPDIQIVPFRGNVQTRLKKLHNGDVDATFLAEAGLRRLDRKDVPRTTIPLDTMLPAIGQGTLCLQTREHDEAARFACHGLNCADTAIANAAERALIAGLDGSCRTPIAGFARYQDGVLTVRGEILSTDGKQHFGKERTASLAQNLADANALGKQIVDDLLKAAGKDIATLLPHRSS